MSEKIQAVRGTQDLFAETANLMRSIEQQAWELVALYGYQLIETPIFEFANVFHRSLGDSSDIVSKETYTFKDRGGDEITLRPEGTAGVARAFVSNGMAQLLPLKLFYSGSMFRYERPQKGRLRQFHQLGVEWLGVQEPWADAESIALAYHLLENLGIADKVNLHINTLGDLPSRQRHRERFISFLEPKKFQLSADSQKRFELNPLRIFDSKDEADQKLLEGAPTVQDCLSDASKKFFDQVIQSLQLLKIPFKVNQQLVRGLDYYNHTVFEFVTDHLGAQGTVLAGGRYNGLVEMLGGPPTSGMGWASGIERLAMLVDPKHFDRPSKLIAVIAADEAAFESCLVLAQKLRHQNRRVELLEPGNLGKRMKKANKLGAAFSIIIGASELAKGVATIKNMNTGEQTELGLDKVPEHAF